MIVVVMEAKCVVHGAKGAIFQPGTKFKTDKDRAEFLKRHNAAVTIKEVEVEDPADNADDVDPDAKVGTGEGVDDGTGTGEDDDIDPNADPDTKAQAAAAKAAAKAAKAQQ